MLNTNFINKLLVSCKQFSWANICHNIEERESSMLSVRSSGSVSILTKLRIFFHDFFLKIRQQYNKILKKKLFS